MTQRNFKILYSLYFGNFSGFIFNNIMIKELKLFR